MIINIITMAKTNDSFSNSRSSWVFIFAGLGLLALFILVIFVRVALFSAIDKTAQDNNYSVNFLESSDSAIENIPEVPEIFGSDPVKGAIDPELTIVEFGDFECPFCKDIALVLDDILVEYPSVQVVWKDLPNPVHLNARSASYAARCAKEQGKFWEFHDFLFANQDILGQDLYSNIAVELNLDIDLFTQCLEENKYSNVVSAGLEQASKYQVTGTPYLFVGDTQVRVFHMTNYLKLLKQNCNNYLSE